MSAEITKISDKVIEKISNSAVYKEFGEEVFALMLGTEDNFFKRMHLGAFLIPVIRSDGKVQMFSSSKCTDFFRCDFDRLNGLGTMESVFMENDDDDLDQPYQKTLAEGIIILPSGRQARSIDTYFMEVFNRRIKESEKRDAWDLIAKSGKAKDLARTMVRNVIADKIKNMYVSSYDENYFAEGSTAKYTPELFWEKLGR